MSKGLSYAYEGTKGHIADVAQNLPQNYKSLFKNGWEDHSHPRAAAKGTFLLVEKETGLRITFDKMTPGANGFAGKDHYHIHNPNASGNKNRYLDKYGEPVARGSKSSHILPKEGD